MDQNKSWWRSKTIILAVLQLAGGLVAAYMSHNPAWAYGAMLKSAVDVGLRLVTSQSIGGE